MRVLEVGEAGRRIFGGLHPHGPEGGPEYFPLKWKTPGGAWQVNYRVEPRENLMLLSTYSSLLEDW